MSQPAIALLGGERFVDCSPNPLQKKGRDYDIREVGEDLYLAVMAARRHEGPALGPDRGEQVLGVRAAA
jgi:hypothetical protein